MAARKNLKHSDKTKDEIRGSQLVNLLLQHALTGAYNGKSIDANRIAAARAALPFLKPVLQSVEQTIKNPMDEMTDEELFEQAKALILSNPALLGRIRSWLQLVDAPALSANADTNTAQEAAK